MHITDMKAMIADIDGTLVVKGETIGPITKKALCVLHQHGIQLGIASGRAINRSMFLRSQDWQLLFPFDVLIGMNGGQVYTLDSGEIHEEYLLERETLREILEWMAPLHLTASIYEDDHMVATEIDDMQRASMARNHIDVISSEGDFDRLCVRRKHNLIFRFHEEDQEKVEAFVKDYLDSHPDKVYTSVITWHGILEIVHKECHKGKGIETYSRLSGINPKQIIGFGDMDNDIGLVKACGIGVAMKNGSPSTKQAADLISEYTCDEDGVGRFLFDHWITPAGWDS